LSKLDEGLFSHQDMIGNSLARQLRARVEAGLLDYPALKASLEAQGSPNMAADIIRRMDDSQAYRRSIQPLLTGLEMKLEVARSQGRSPVLSRNEMADLGRKMKLVQELSVEGLPVSRAFFERYLELIRQFGRQSRVDHPRAAPVLEAVFSAAA